MRDKIYNVIKDLQRGNINYTDAIDKLCDLHLVSKWIPIKDASKSDWDNVFKNNLKVKFDDGTEAKYGDGWNYAEVTHISVC